ncbi:odorant receptor 4-like [Lutzomyia longipalpis]|uniref:odorant receptor 4-like n=1 Tax=Lutzomyia longipalpis TaxID=7200 RepID=UPI0024835DE6|nr:odorant receptor 4-like [Lutzomyia longipalpis]
MLFLIPGIPQSSLFFYPCNITYQILLYFAILEAIMGADAVIMTTICYYRGENQAILELIEELNEPEVAQKNSKDILRTICQIHQIVTANSKTLLHCYWHVYFHKLITIILYLCTILYIFQSFNAKFVLAALVCVAIVLSQIFILCFFGQLLQNSSEAIAEALYMTKWYEMPIESQKNLLLLLTRFQRPAKIEAFGFGVISIYTFAQIIKAAASYASIAYTVLQ